MLKKLTAFLGSLAIACFVISGGYGSWQGDLEVEGNIIISNQYPDGAKEFTGLYDTNILFEKAQKNTEYRNLKYIYFTDGDAAYSYLVDGGSENIDMFSNKEQMAADQNSNDMVKQNGSKGIFNNNINGIYEKSYNYQSENYIQDSYGTNYAYILDENESRQIFEMGEVKEQKEYVYKEGSNIDYNHQATGNN